MKPTFLESALIPKVEWGLISYEQSLAQQEALVEDVAVRRSPEVLVFCSHPPVVTLGRGTLPGDVFGWTGSAVEVARGGRATYHGPSQTVVYPILNLDCRGRDLHAYMRALERAIVETLSTYGIESVGRRDDATGVWINDRKVASIGIGVRKWISYHGLAINLEKDPSAFQGLKPCGFSSDTMISVEEILGRKISRPEFEERLYQKLNQVLVLSAQKSEVRTPVSVSPDLL